MDVIPILNQVNLVVRDIDRSLEFYRLLGVPFGEPSGPHADYRFENGISLELDQDEFAALWNRGNPGVDGGSAVFTLAVPARDDVDATWRRMTEAGHASRQAPYDTFWGCRFAIVADPDGHQIGLMSPRDDARRYWPPSQAPVD